MTRQEANLALVSYRKFLNSFVESMSDDEFNRSDAISYVRAARHWFPILEQMMDRFEIDEKREELDSFYESVGNFIIGLDVLVDVLYDSARHPSRETWMM